jgi:biotin carboxylase
MKARPFVLEQAVRTAHACGFVPLLLDRPERRFLSRELIPDERFVAARRDDPSPGNVADLVSRAVATGKDHGVICAAVYTGFNAYAELAALLADRLGARGNSGDAVRRAHTKTLMRDELLEEAGLAVPYRIVDSCDSARAALRELEGPVVVKPARGAGSRGVRTGISTERDVVEAWESVRSELASWRGRPEAALHLLDEEMPIMVEQQLMGQEVDVELVLQNGRLIFAAVADNPHVSLPCGVETCTTYPSSLPTALQDSLIETARLALRRLQLTDGNFHVEMVQTAAGPRVIEVNARMGGAFVWEAVRHVHGVDLVELGVKAMLGVTLEPVAGSPCCAVEACFFIPSVSGRLIAVEGFEALSGLRGFCAARLWKHPGDAVLNPCDDASDYLGFAAFSGATGGEARVRALDALRRVRFWIRTTEGAAVESPGVYLHPAPAAERIG